MSDKSSIIKEAQRYFARGQIDKAIAEWEKLIEEYPDGNSYNTIGDLYLKKGDKNNAVDSFHKAANFFLHEGFSLKALAIYKKILNINPADSDALFYLGGLSEEKGLTTDAMKYYLAAADSFSKEGKKEKLIGVYDKILSISPTNIPLRNKVAEIYANEGLISEAVKQYFQIAILYTEKGDIEKSIGYYQKVLDIQPSNKETILGINYLYEKTGNLKRAIEQIKEAASLLPQDAYIHLRCAELYIKDERFGEAKECLRKVTEIEPDNIKSRRLLGGIYVKEGNREKAWIEYLPVLDEMILEEKYDDAVKLLDSFKDVDPLETRKRLISIYKQIGDQVQVANELISLGNVYIAKEMQKEALDCYKEVLSITPDDSLKAKVIELEHKTHYDLGTVYMEMGLIDDAIREFQRSSSDPKSFLPSSSMLSKCYMEKGFYSIAIDVLKSAFEKMEDKDESYWAMKYDLAKAYERNGNLKEALDSYTEVYEWNSKFRDVPEKINHVKAMMAKTAEKRKPKDRKERISYI